MEVEVNEGERKRKKRRRRRGPAYLTPQASLRTERESSESN